MRRRALVLAASMGATAALARWTDHRRDAARVRPLELETVFPESFGDWRIDPLTRDMGIVRPANTDGKLYGIYDRVLERTYVDARGYRIMLSVAYGADQSAGMDLHRPEICYRYAGYQIDAQREVQLALADLSVPATVLQTQLPGRPEPLLYWTILGGLAAREASEIRWRRLHLALLGHRVTGMLVRVSSVDPDPQRAFAHQAAFADALVRAVAPSQRAEVLGQAADA
jgi:EpsI family protein